MRCSNLLMHGIAIPSFELIERNVSVLYSQSIEDGIDRRFQPDPNQVVNVPQDNLKPGTVKQ